MDSIFLKNIQGKKCKKENVPKGVSLAQGDEYCDFFIYF